MGLAGTRWGAPPPPPPKRSRQNTPLVVGVGVLATVMAIGAALSTRESSSADSVASSRARSASARATSSSPTARVTSSRPTPTSPRVTTTAPRPSPKPTPTTKQTPYPKGSKLPVPATPAGVLPARSWDPLPAPSASGALGRVQRSALFARPIPAGVRCPAVPANWSNAAFQSYTQGLLDCYYRAWLPAFKEVGIGLPKTQNHWYNGTATTACGRVTNYQVSFYCNGHIYVHYRLIEGSTQWWRLWAATTMAHEFAHHVQAEAGLFEAQYGLAPGTANYVAMQRRIELQADCISVRQILITTVNRTSRQDYLTVDEWARTTQQDAEHGGIKANIYWKNRGFYSTHLNGCNTFVVPNSWVA